MGLRQGPEFDRYLMRAKDIGQIISTWAGLIGGAIFLASKLAGYVERIRNLEAMITAQNITITKVLVNQEEIKEELNKLMYPDRYGRRQR